MEKETIKCKLCESEMTQLGRHLKIKHNIDSTEYRRLFPDAPMMSDSRKMKNSRKDISPNNVEFWIKKGHSNDEALLKIVEHKRKLSVKSKISSPFSRQYWIEKGHTEAEVEKLLKENNSRNLDFFINKCGEEVGTKKFDEMLQKRAYSNSKQKMIDDGRSKEEIEDISKLRWSQTSLEAFQNRFGIDDGLKKFNIFCNQQKTKSKRCLEFWSSLGLTDEESRIELKKFQSRGLPFWIEKYGNELGLKKYKDWVSRVTEFSNLSGVSKSSQTFFKSFFSVDSFNFKNIQYFDHSNSEFCLYTKDYKLYLDCYFEIDDKKFGIEYNGDYWHANPRIYESSDVISYPDKKVEASKVWDRDFLKKSDLNAAGIVVYYVWETDVIDDSTMEICKIIEYITEELNKCK